MPILAVVAIGLTAASIAMQNKAARDAQRTVKNTAAYNNVVDQVKAQQIDQDANTNIRAMREEAATYISKQQGQYAAAGIIANTGSPLAVQATTAGRLELRAQHVFMDSRAREGMAYSEGAMGLRYGQSQNDQIGMQATAATLSGAAKITGQAYSGYQTFGSAGSSTSTAIQPASSNVRTDYIA